MDIVDKIKAFIDKTPGMNQERLSELTKIPKGRISDYVTRKYEVGNVHQVRALAEALGCTMEYLIDGRHGWPPPKIVATPQLTEEEWKVVEAARLLGDPGLALRRIMKADEVRMPAPTEETTGAAGETRPAAQRKK
jgi:hypothetical protein